MQEGFFPSFQIVFPPKFYFSFRNGYALSTEVKWFCCFWAIFFVFVSRRLSFALHCCCLAVRSYKCKDVVLPGVLQQRELQDSTQRLHFSPTAGLVCCLLTKRYRERLSTSLACLFFIFAVAKRSLRRRVSYVSLSQKRVMLVVVVIDFLRKDVQHFRKGKCVFCFAVLLFCCFFLA